MKGKRSLTSRLDELEALVQINELTKVRAELKEENLCPVCGSLSIPLPQTFRQRLRRQKSAWSCVKEELADLQKNQKEADRKKLTFLKIGCVFF